MLATMYLKKGLAVAKNTTVSVVDFETNQDCGHVELDLAAVCGEEEAKRDYVLNLVKTKDPMATLKFTLSSHPLDEIPEVGPRWLARVDAVGAWMTGTHSPSHSLTHSVTHALTHSRTHALTHSRTHSLTHSHTHALTRALTHSLPPSIPPSLPPSIHPSIP